MITALSILLGAACAGLFFAAAIRFNLKAGRLAAKWNAAETFLPSRWLAFRKERELRRQLPSALISLASSVRAGLSLPQAIQAAGKSLSWPLGDEFRALTTEVEHGGNFDRALAGLEGRTGVPEIRYMAAGLRMARAAGGGLAPLLERLADSMRERERLRGQVKSLTAQGRLSGWVVGAIPAVLLLGIGLIDPEFIRPLFLTRAGWFILALAGLLELAGIFAIRAVIRIEP